MFLEIPINVQHQCTWFTMDTLCGEYYMIYNCKLTTLVTFNEHSQTEHYRQVHGHQHQYWHIIWPLANLYDFNSFCTQTICITIIKILY